MADNQKAGEQSMDDILASIRRIISEDNEPREERAANQVETQAPRPDAPLLTEPLSPAGPAPDDDLSDILEPAPVTLQPVRPLPADSPPPEAAPAARAGEQDTWPLEVSDILNDRQRLDAVADAPGETMRPPAPLAAPPPAEARAKRPSLLEKVGALQNSVPREGSDGALTANNTEAQPVRESNAPADVQMQRAGSTAPVAVPPERPVDTGAEKTEVRAEKPVAAKPQAPPPADAAAGPAPNAPPVARPETPASRAPVARPEPQSQAAPPAEPVEKAAASVAKPAAAAKSSGDSKPATAAAPVTEQSPAPGSPVAPSPAAEVAVGAVLAGGAVGAKAAGAGPGGDAKSEDKKPKAQQGAPAQSAPPAAAAPAKPPAPGKVPEAAAAKVTAKEEQPQRAVTLEEVVAQTLQPMLKSWLDQNLERVMRETVSEEMAKAAAGQTSDSKE